MRIGTLKELNVKPGDVVECVKHHYTLPDVFIPGKHYTVNQDGVFRSEYGNTLTGNCAVWRIISRASDTPKFWRDMTDAEKGALLLAAHKGKTIEFLSDLIDNPEWITAKPSWEDWCAYRVKPEPVRETVPLYIRNPFGKKIGTIDLIDGKPDPDSIKMETIK